MFQILHYHYLDVQPVKRQFEKTVQYLQQGNFQSADVRKLRGVEGFYRAKLDDTNRLLFKIGEYRGQTYLFLLEIILNHAYDKSRFLNGARVDENKLVLQQPGRLDGSDFVDLTYLNPKTVGFTITDKIVTLDEQQEDLLLSQLPLILMGPAGSGKTVLTLEKMKNLEGKVLYISLSDYLVEKARSLYRSSHHPGNEKVEVDFLSFQDFILRHHLVEGREATYAEFRKWFERHRNTFKIKDVFKLYEEIQGVLTGAAPEDRPYLTREEYGTLGVRQSIFLNGEKEHVYTVFQKYLAWLKAEGLYDSNIAAWESKQNVQPEYDFVLVDEVQDMTNVKLSLILQALKHPGNFIFCGDANQVVHPNFFNWTNIKRLLHGRQSATGGEVLRILPGNFRNSTAITELSNRLLKLKNVRFGSLDRESTFLVDARSNEIGEVQFALETQKVMGALRECSEVSAKIAIIVLRESDKETAKNLFKTPLIFTIQEAKGLEYEQVVLYNFLSGASAEFKEICKDLVPKELTGELIYNRPKDKADRSLDAYKFYINALYVGMTRAVKNLFVVERNESHRLLNLLGVKKLRKTVDIHITLSTRQEWQEEAHRLEKSGKSEQAQQIRAEHLAYKKADWEVLTLERMFEIRQVFMNNQSVFKNRNRALLTDAALFYNDVLSLLAMNLKNAKHIITLLTREKQRLMGQLLMPYRTDQVQRIEPLIKKYGIDYRNHLNLTPLMLAALAGAVKIAEYLVGNGADLLAMDNVGRTAYQLALKRVYEDEKYAQQKFPLLYPVLLPPYIETRIMKNKIIFPSDSLDYYLVAIMLTLQREFFELISKREHAAFQVDDFLKIIRHIPKEHGSPAFTKRESIAQCLKKHEFFEHRTSIITQLRRGYYCLTPIYTVKVNGEWSYIMHLSGFYDTDFLEHLPAAPVRHFAKDIKDFWVRVKKAEEADLELGMESLQMAQTPDESLMDWEA